MNIFTDVKTAVTTRQAAVFYGLKVSASGMTCCPFHPDKHPSMKVDERYYCFGCHQTGDVIRFLVAYLLTENYFIKRIEKHHWKNNEGKEVVYGA